MKSRNLRHGPRTKSETLPTVTLRMESMAQGGEAFAHLEDGRACFVAGALTGELAEVSLTAVKKDFARGKAVRIVETSAARVKPKCPFYGKCGGCSLQHASAKFQLESYRNSVENLFRRFARSELPDGWKIHSGYPYGYRNRARLFRIGERFGFRESQSHKIVPVEECAVLSAALNRALREGSLPKASELSVFDNGEGKVSYFYPGMSQEEIVQKSFGAVHVGGRKISMDAESFFQSNLGLLPELVETVREAAGTGNFLIDLFSGVGFFASILQESFDRIVTVERDPNALRHAQRNVPRAQNVSSAAEDWLSKNDASRADVLIVDPPRTGLPSSALDAIVQAAPQKLLYVSCDPVTLARDFSKLSSDGYKICRAEGFAFYPQTPHFEMFLELSR